LHLSLLTNTNNSSLGEVLPIFLMFSSDAQQEENFRIRSVGTNARVLSIVLLKYSNLLYPDTRDEDGQGTIHISFCSYL
jgi:hypothetical protein